ncbi:MAG TPA: DnaJ domain-containing protein, partial [Pseudonocardiaceae bacterium]|nr:DnaJ domain-containing protein [Pseudonocardiaceae bacterium]
YGILGLDQSATRSQIKSAYRAKARRSHPDMGGSETEFHALHDAYQALVDPIRRAAYDRSLRWSMPAPVRRAGNFSTAPVRRRTGRAGRLRDFGGDKAFTAPALDLDVASLPWWEQGARPRRLTGSGPSREQVFGAVGGWCALLLLTILLPVDSVPVLAVLWTLVAAGAVTIQRLARQYLRTQRAERAFLVETGGRAEFGRPGDEPDQLAERLTAQAIGDYLLRLPGSKAFHGLTRPGSVFADVDHAVLRGRRLVLVESKLWLPGHYEADDDGSIYRNGHPFHGGATHLPRAVAAYRRLLPDVDVRGVLVVHPNRAGVLSTDVEDGVVIPPLTAEGFVRTIGSWLAEEQVVLDRGIFRIVLGQLASTEH